MTYKEAFFAELVIGIIIAVPLAGALWLFSSFPFWWIVLFSLLPLFLFVLTGIGGRWGVYKAIRQDDPRRP